MLSKLRKFGVIIFVCSQVNAKWVFVLCLISKATANNIALLYFNYELRHNDNNLHVRIGSIAKNLSDKKVWLIGSQNSFSGENFSGLSFYTEGNQGKTDKLVDKTLAD